MPLKAEPRPCSSCNSSHLGQVPCGMGWLQRLRSVKLDPRATPTKTKRAYYDPEPIKATFGEHAKDELLEQTDGLGTPRRDEHGDYWVQDRHSNEWSRLDEDTIDRVYLAGDSEHEAE